MKQKNLIYPYSLGPSVLYCLFSRHTLSSQRAKQSAHLLLSSSPLSLSFHLLSSALFIRSLQRWTETKRVKPPPLNPFVFKPRMTYPASHTHILNPYPQCTDGFTAEQHPDSCFGFLAVGERYDVSFKSVPVSAVVFLHNLAQDADSREGGMGSVRKHTH